MSTTLFDKVWDSHVVSRISNGPDVLFIDRHMVHEVTSPVAFLGLKNRGIKVLYPERTFRYRRSQYSYYQSASTSFRQAFS